MADRTCSDPDCDKPRRARGWCIPHYRRALASGQFVPRQRGTVGAALPGEVTCLTAECDRKAVTRGLCNRCYGRAYRAGALADAPRIYVATPHRVRNVSRSAMTGDCSVCGPGIRIVIHKGHSPRCRFAKNGRRRTRSRVSTYNPATRHAKQIWAKYRLTLAEYEDMVTQQAGLCAICRKPQKRGGKLFVDHSHTTGRVRGLLCTLCNSFLGRVGDDPQKIIYAATYVTLA